MLSLFINYKNLRRSETINSVLCKVTIVYIIICHIATLNYQRRIIYKFVLNKTLKKNMDLLRL